MVRIAQLWRRQAGRLLAALLLAVLTLGPGLDAVVCAGDNSPRAHAETVVSASMADANGHVDQDCAGGCVHGHFHPGAPILPPTLLAGYVSTDSERLTPPLAARVASQEAKVLERPPRA